MELEETRLLSRGASCASDAAMFGGNVRCCEMQIGDVMMERLLIKSLKVWFRRARWLIGGRATFFWAGEAPGFTTRDDITHSPSFHIHPTHSLQLTVFKMAEETDKFPLHTAAREGKGTVDRIKFYLIPSDIL